MRSPRKPGYEPLTVPTPSWVGTASATPITTKPADGSTISDLHFDGIDGNAINFGGINGLTIERCTFANCWQGIYLLTSTNVTIRHCAFWNIGEPLPLAESVTGKHAILMNECDTVLIEDCWSVNPPSNLMSDNINLFKTNNGTVRRCFVMGDGDNKSNAGIIVGDGTSGGGDNQLVEDNVLIDATIAAVGTNNVVRRNVVLNRGLVASMDDRTAGIATYYSSAHAMNPDRPAGPTEVSNNEVRYYASTGQLRREVQTNAALAVSGLATNPVAPLIDEYSRWDLTGYYGAP